LKKQQLWKIKSITGDQIKEIEEKRKDVGGEVGVGRRPYQYHHHQNQAKMNDVDAERKRKRNEEKDDVDHIAATVKIQIIDIGGVEGVVVENEVSLEVGLEALLCQKENHEGTKKIKLEIIILVKIKVKVAEEAAVEVAVEAPITMIDI
jgi:hypothetical protein